MNHMKLINDIIIFLFETFPLNRWISFSAEFLYQLCMCAYCRLYKQTARVMDLSLLSTTNLHEVKHWIEPGESRGGRDK